MSFLELGCSSALLRPSSLTDTDIISQHINQPVEASQQIQELDMLDS